MKKLILSFCLFLLLSPSVKAFSSFDDDLTDFEDLKSQGVVLSDMPEELRTTFSRSVQNLCHSILDYDLDTDFDDMKTEFHQTLNCLFNDAFSRVPHKIIEDVENKTHDKKTEVLNPPNAFPADNCFFKDSDGKNTETPLTLENYQGHIERQGFQTQCGVLEMFPTVITPYSSCRVAEIALTEYCGYQKYLWGKMKDNRTFQSEFYQQNISNKNPTPADWNTLRKKEQTRYFHEMKKTKRAILDTTFLYQKFEQNFRIHTWYTVILEKLKDIHSTLILLRETIDTYPLKFLNATIPSP